MGNVHVVDSAGDHVPDARAGGFDCICGDREAKAREMQTFGGNRKAIHVRRLALSWAFNFWGLDHSAGKQSLWLLCPD